jgi:hypothetical protein
MPSAHQNVQSLGAGGLYGTNTTYGGGGVPVARSELDFLRLGVGREPSAEYPDGYLGTIRSRRDDRGRANSGSERLLQGVQTRVTQRSYQRGVHRGERIDQSDYYYPDNLRPDRGIKRQMRSAQVGNVWQSKRNAINPDLVPAPHLVNDGKAGPAAKGSAPGEIDKRRADQWARMRPNAR